MPNISQIFKAEILRVSRKEIKKSLITVRSSTSNLKKTVIELKTKIGILESENKKLLGYFKKVHVEQLPVNPENIGKVRITSKTVRKIREKLGLSQQSFSKLIGISSQNVFVMEHKPGRLNLRKPTLLKLLAIRNIGKREALKRLEDLE
jgi:DNA-binding transcriptional regulator YiaG